MTKEKRKAPSAARRDFRAKQLTLSCGLYLWQHRGLKGFLTLPLALQQVTSLLLLHLSLSASEAPQGKTSSRSTPRRGKDLMATSTAPSHAAPGLSWPCCPISALLCSKGPRSAGSAPCISPRRAAWQPALAQGNCWKRARAEGWHRYSLLS